MTVVRTLALIFALMPSLLAQDISLDSSANKVGESAISIENYADADVVRYSVVTLRGLVSNGDSGIAVVENVSSDKETRIVRANVIQGRFKALVELVPGRNDFLIGNGSLRLNFSLIYRRSFNENVVRLISFVPSDSALSNGGNDETLIPMEDGEIVRKLVVAAKLWQTADAERLFDLGYGRRTFALETDDTGEVVVWRKRGKRLAKEYRELPPRERFNTIRREVLEDSQRIGELVFFVCFDSRAKNESDFSSKDAIALGVDSFSLLDAQRTIAWPESIAVVASSFSDSSPIPAIYLKDSAYRGTRWALTASTLGAGWHELSHAFGLKHTSDPSDVMSRGFDRFNRVFMVYEPKCAFHDGLIVGEKDNVGWSRENAEILLRSKWITE